MNSLSMPTAAVTVLVATAAAGTYISTPLLAGFLSSTPFLWVAANAIVIVIWLLSSSRRSNTASSADGHAGDVLSAVDDLYPSSDYEGFSSVVSSRGEAPPVVSTPRRQAREATAARRTDRPRVPMKPAAETAATRTDAEPRGRPDSTDDKKCGGDVHEVPPPRTVVAAAAVEAKPEDGAGGDDDVSLDSLWQSMVQRRAVRPVSVKKSETWGNDELPRLQRAAEKAAERREMRKSASTAVRPPQAAEAAPSAARQLGWRTRDVLVRAHDDLLRRAESLIRRHHEQLRLQRQESDQRRAMELQQRGRSALIRV